MPPDLSQSLLPLDTSYLKAGLRLAVGLSGGADSVALTRVLAARASELGIVLHAAHLHHGLRGAEADRDREFSAELARSLGIPFHADTVNTAAEAAEHHESIEEAARRLRYGWFRKLMVAERLQAVATAHTLDDQAETVLGKLIRGAWTEGLSGIHPVVEFGEGRVLRPMLGISRAAIEQYLKGLGQGWCDDSSNVDPAYTRNRIRHELLPALQGWNPRIREHLGQTAELARAEERYWQGEIERIAPQLILTGRAVRGGGRAALQDSSIALDIVRLAALPVAIQRRLLRYVAGGLGPSLSFDATESLRLLAVNGRSGQKLALPGPITAERSPRELRLSPSISKAAPVLGIELPVPGGAAAFGLTFEASATAPAVPAIIRNWRAGDRVTLRYSSGPRKLKEVLDRLKISGSDRLEWPVVEWQGQIVWMRGAELQPVSELKITAQNSETVL